MVAPCFLRQPMWIDKIKKQILQSIAMTMTSAIPCPLCHSLSTERFLEVEGKPYWRCHRCDLRFLDPARLPSAEEERAHYQHHENDPLDPRYRRFLTRLASPLLARLPPCRDGLDYGCGPGPALAMMLEEAGHRIALYDPLFQPHDEVLGETYDVITCSETAEHFHDPRADFDRLHLLLRPGGWLGLMTCFQTDDDRFANWHYRRDPTHVVFYRETTIRFIAALYGWGCSIPVKDVALFHKSPASAHTT